MTAPAPRRLPYGREWLDLPDEPFRLDPILPPSPPDGERAPIDLGAAFERPVASPRTEELFSGARKVLVVVSDATRATGAAQFLPLLVDRIRAVSAADVTFIVASGIHRRPTPEEIEAIEPDALALIVRAAEGSVRDGLSLLDQAITLLGGEGLAHLAAGFGAGIVTIGAAIGIGRIAGAAMEGSARNPQAAGEVRTSMIISCALIEGVSLFGLVVCILLAVK